ncbi:hypothetical protein MSG28_013964, partial [Choristoneura fumiferana]
SLSPPPERAPALLRLRRFLSALLQFAGDASADAGERVRTLVHNLVVSAAASYEYPPRERAPASICTISRFYEQTNGSHDDFPPHAKRPPPSSLFLNPPFLYPLPSNASLFDYGHPYHMVEKTKRALAILQQRGQPGVEPAESSDIKRAASEIMAAAVRQTEERVAERAVGAAEARALELVAAERKERRSPPPPASPPHQQTVSSVVPVVAVCSGRDQKPTALRTSPPATQPALPNLANLPNLPNLPSLPKPLTRATTPIAPAAPDNRLSLSNLNSAE